MKIRLEYNPKQEKPYKFDTDYHSPHINSKPIYLLKEATSTELSSPNNLLYHSHLTY